MTDATPLDHALFLAGLGWQVFPVHSVVAGRCTCGDADCERPGKHPRTRHGLRDATDDEETVRAWWAEHPDANIGVATGEGSGVWVLDLDRRGEDDPGRRELEDRLRDVETCEQVTGSGGRHLVFAWDGEAGEVRNRGDVLSGVDVRGEGGYVIVPPSRHASGGAYAWAEERDPTIAEPAPAPAWLLEIVLGEGSSDVPRRSPGTRPDLLLGPLSPREVSSVRSALEAISPDCDHETWYRVGMALESTHAGEQAFAMWDEWSSRATRQRGTGKGPVYPGTEELRRRWRSFGRRDEEVGVSTLFWYARQAGWEGAEPQAAPRSDPVTNGAHAPARAPWREPEWVWGRHAPPRFPVEDAYPDSLWWLRRWVEALAWTFQMPTDFPALVSLAMGAGAAGGRYEVAVPRVEWREPCALWVICAMPSGMGKSLAFAPLVAPFREFERGLREGDALSEHEARMRAADLEVKRVERQLGAKGVDDAARDVLEERLQRAILQREMRAANRPQSKRVLVSDATSEALAEYLEEHHGRALVADPEGGVFDHALGGGSKPPRLDVWLKSYSGETIDERRVGQAGAPRSRGRYVRSPLVSVAVATQPRALGPLVGNELAGAKGFLARFLTVVVPPDLPELFVREGELPSDVKGRWGEAVRRLLETPRVSEPTTLLLSEPARELFVEWGQRELDEVRGGTSDDRDEYLSAWSAKFRGKVLRIALALHVLAYEYPASSAVGAETMRAALAWVPYLRGHHELVSQVLRHDPDLVVAERVLAWCDRHAEKIARGRLVGFSRGELYQGLKGRSTSAVARVDDLNGPLAALCEAGWLRPLGRLEPRRNGVPAATRYEPHPELSAHLAQHRAAEEELGRQLGQRGL